MARVSRASSGPDGESLVADLYLGYGLSSTIRRTATPAPDEPCPLPLVACVVRTEDHAGVNHDNSADGSDGEPSAATMGSRSARGDEPGPRPTTPGQSSAVRAAIGRGDVYQVNLVQHLSATFAGSPRSLAARLAPLTQPNELPFADCRLACLRRAMAGRSSPSLPSSSSPARATRVWTRPIKGTRPHGSSGGAPRLGEGRRRARDDRRPRTERPLPHLPAGQRALAAR